MEYLPELVGRLIAVLLFALPAVYFLDRGLRDGPRSRRLANLALFCGLASFILPEIALGWSPANWPTFFFASACLRVLLGFAGVALAAAALVGRRNGTVGVARPILGAGFSLMHVVVGWGLFMFISFTQPSVPWVYQSPDNAFRLNLPSAQWKQAESTRGLAFTCPIPRMQAAVLALERNQTEADFGRAVEAFRARVAASSQLRSQAKFRQGTNAAGNHYHYFTGMDSSPDGKPVFVACSVTWCPRKQIVIEVLFEGMPRMFSQTGKAAEMKAFESSAETICLSVD